MPTLAEAAQSYRRPWEFKTLLPIAFVMEQFGYDVVDVDPDGRLHCLCPFHADTAPSFDIFGDRWGCFPCGKTGDVLDLIREGKGGNFGEVVGLAEELLSQLPANWIAEQKEFYQKREFNLNESIERIRNSYSDTWGLERIASHYGWPPSEFLRDRWRVGCEWNQVLIPYFDREGALVSYRRRGIGTHVISAPGTRNDTLYGEWLDTDPDKPILLCEGESDTWAADYILGSSHACLGVPGAGNSLSSFASVSFNGRYVVIALDGDEAGQRAALRWYEDLKPLAAEVSIWVPPEGKDIRQLLLEPDRMEGNA